MICTMRPHLHCNNNNTPSTSAVPMPSHNDAILRALEREREALLAKTHAAFSSYTHDSSDEEDLDDEEEMAPRYDVNGRQAAFRETVRQRQARLEYLRRQDAAKRRASRRNESEETVMSSLSSSQFLSGYLSPPASPSSPASSITSDSDSDSLSEPDSDNEWDAPAPRVHLYAVEEDEDEDDYITRDQWAADFQAAALKTIAMHYHQQQQQQQHVAKSPSSPRSPVARAPSLESISEDPEFDA